MPDLNTIVEELSKLTVVEAAELSKTLEEKWGVSAAAPVAVAAPAAAAGGAAPGAARSAGRRRSRSRRSAGRRPRRRRGRGGAA